MTERTPAEIKNDLLVFMQDKAPVLQDLANVARDLGLTSEFSDSYHKERGLPIVSVRAVMQSSDSNTFTSLYKYFLANVIEEALAYVSQTLSHPGSRSLIRPLLDDCFGRKIIHHRDNLIRRARDGDLMDAPPAVVLPEEPKPVAKKTIFGTLLSFFTTSSRTEEMERQKPSPQHRTTKKEIDLAAEFVALIDILERDDPKLKGLDEVLSSAKGYPKKLEIEAAKTTGMDNSSRFRDLVNAKKDRLENKRGGPGE